MAAALLEGIDEDTVDFRATYDGAGQEPVVLPANFPNCSPTARPASPSAWRPASRRTTSRSCARRCCTSSSTPTPTSTSWSRWCRGRTSRPAACIVEPREQILEAYKTGRGGFRLRAKWEKEDTGRGTYQIVVTEIPYQVQKAKLVERIAELIDDKKLPLLGDARDESAETVRLVLEPKSRAVDPVVLMESLFKLTELEVRFSLNMNVLSGGQVPGVLSLRDVLEALAGAPPGRAGAALAVPPEEDRASPGGARRLPHRLSQPRRGDPHRPLRGRAQGQADQALQADRGAGRGDPQPAPEIAVAARGDRDQGRARQAQQGAARDQVAAEVRRPAVGAHRRRGEGDARGLLQEDRARPPPHLVRRRAGHRGRSRAGDDREGADHRHPVREGLDPRHEGPHRRPLQARVQAGRRPASAR